MPYHRLDVYRKAYDLALDVHRRTLEFPKIEQYAMAQQLRGSSKSIVAKVAEGMGKQSSPKEVVRFVRMAIGSCDETRVWLDFARDLGYIDEPTHNALDERYREVGRMLTGLVRKWST